MNMKNWEWSGVMHTNGRKSIQVQDPSLGVGYSCTSDIDGNLGCRIAVQQLKQKFPAYIRRKNNG